MDHTGPNDEDGDDLFDDYVAGRTTPKLREAPAGRFFADSTVPTPAKPQAPAKADTGHDPSGHRARLRKRLLDGGQDALADHEVIEYLLMTAIPRRDTKPIARTLIKRFGSLAGVFNADPAALAGHPGMGETSAAALHIDYLTVDMAHLTVERVRVLYLDTKNRLIRDEHLADGSIDEAAIHPREVIHKGLNLGAAGLILVHNHPSGNPEPSKADVAITHRIAEAGRHMGIVVHDHVIVGREGHVSLRAKGLI